MRRIVICLLLLFITASPAGACIGARYAGIGWCGVAVADDATASYWNPAALVWASDGFVYDNIYKRTAFAYKQGKYGVHGCDDWGKTYFDISCGFQINENSAWGLSIGYHYAKYSFVTAYYRGIFPSVSYIHKITPNLNFGVLLQGLHNLRPGVCYQNKYFLLSIESYDLLSISVPAEFKIGVEFYPLDFLVLRTSFNDGVMKYGFGIKNQKYSFDGFWDTNTLYIGISYYDC